MRVERPILRGEVGVVPPETRFTSWVGSQLSALNSQLNPPGQATSGAARSQAGSAEAGNSHPRASSR